MCGIAGVFHRNGIGSEDFQLIELMNKIQSHRGPDDEGIFSDTYCCLGHRRLSIIDLSQAGHQPFYSDDKRYVLIYNGEIYNYIELRAELESFGWHFRTKTDTEVLLKAYQHFGPVCLEKFNGMFAFAIYDTQKNLLFLARDRVGIKPLYYILHDNKLFFSSEIKALRAITHINFSLNKQALFDYLVFNRTDIADETFLNEIKRIPKGHYAIFDGKNLHCKPWWNPEDYLASDGDNQIAHIIQDIEQILVSATKLRMRSDVPVGSCLSGGLDSSILIGILFEHKLAIRDYHTFSITFANDPVDESHYIDCLNFRYPFINHRFSPSQDDAFKNLKDFVYTCDEPTTGPSFYAQYELMRMVKQKGITVLLDGQGGDECFAGYHYLHGFYLTGLYHTHQYPKFLLNLLKILIRRQRAQAYQTFLFQILPESLRTTFLFRNCPFIPRDFFEQYLYTSLVYKEFLAAPNLNTSLARHFLYKLEHLLRTEDRNSMAFSVEARLPYLDYRLIEYTLGLHEDLKIRSGETKYLQKLALRQYTVPEISGRKDKIGFAVPARWLRTDAWDRKGQEAVQYCQDSVPRIFTRYLSARIQKDTILSWKIIQLAAWHQMVFN